MKKIISLFQRNYETDGLVRDEIVPGAEWVAAGEGQATRKFDGTCCMIRGGKLFKRHDCKRGKKPPEGWEAAQDPDPITGHHPGWIPVGDGPADQWHRQAWESQSGLPDGTYELCGPKIQSDAEREYRLLRKPGEVHILISHDCFLFAENCNGILRDACPRAFDALREWFRDKDIEGIVWHHPDGRMVKIKKRDFGLPRKPA